MTPADITQVVNELFTLLEQQCSSRPILLLVLQSLETIADGLIPQLITNMAKRGKV